MRENNLSYELFLQTAQRVGIDINNRENLQLLFPEVLAMLERMLIIDDVYTTDIHLSSNVDLLQDPRSQ
jgi:hypothetical protein